MTTIWHMRSSILSKTIRLKIPQSSCSPSQLRYTISSNIIRKRMASTLPKLPVFEAIASHDPQSIAVIHSLSGRKFTYGELLQDVAEAKEKLRSEAGNSKSLDGQRIAFLVENSYDYVVTLLSILGANSIALPLSPAFPAHELQYILDQSEALMLLSSAKFDEKGKEVIQTGLQHSPKFIKLEKKLGGGKPEKVALVEGYQNDDAGMMLYTSGTTNRPKGVLLPQSVMTAQAHSLIKAWSYTPTDHLLHVLPLHHIHGTINAIFTPLFSGSTIEFLFPFNAHAVWNRLTSPFLPAPPPTTTTDPNEQQENGTPTPSKEKITFFTVVPTVYNRLLATFPTLNETTQQAAQTAISPPHLRLSISGSAALPTPTKQAWTSLSNGNILLERYGMTEVGMALSCGLHPNDRIDGSVGWPLPTVEARLVDTETNEIILDGEELDAQGKERDGEIQLRGPTVFSAYFRNEEATRKEFVDGVDGRGLWFRTGDVAVRRWVEGSGRGDSGEWAKGPAYFIRGRKSADIIKTGGEKVSALEIERELLSLPQITDAAVVAIPSKKWGQKVGCVVVLNEAYFSSSASPTSSSNDPTSATNDADPSINGLKPKRTKFSPLDMRRAMKARVVAYKIPQVMRVVDEIPKNAMGKVNKKTLVKDIFATDTSDNEL